MKELIDGQQVQEPEIIGSKPAVTPIGNILDAFQRAADANLPIDPGLVRLESMLEGKKLKQKELERQKRQAEIGLQKISQYYYELGEARMADTRERSEPVSQEIVRQKEEAIGRIKSGEIRPGDVFLVVFLEDQIREGIGWVSPNPDQNEKNFEKLKDQVRRRVTEPAQRLDEVTKYVREHPGELILIEDDFSVYDGSIISTGKRWIAGKIGSLCLGLRMDQYREGRSISENVCLIFEPSNGTKFVEDRESEGHHWDNSQFGTSDSVKTSCHLDGVIGDGQDGPIMFPDFSVGEQAIKKQIEGKKTWQIDFGMYAAIIGAGILPSLNWKEILGDRFDSFERSYEGLLEKTKES